MCGRYSHLYNWKQLQRLMALTTAPIEWPPKYNVAPSQVAPVVRAIDGGDRGMDLLRWGLVPGWADDLKFGYKTINARAETITSSPAFRSAIKRRRCIVPVSGYYEWQKIDDKTKQPFYFTAADEEPLAFAGLWESWKPKDGSSQDPVETFTIITTAPNEFAARFHDRMPVILDRADFERWLDPKVDAPAVIDLLHPAPDGVLMAVPVSTLVNSPRNESPECIVPVKTG
ncbi:MAG: SOS response-associated peptidase [Phycisphaerales bacterium]|nr:SOS response-associated peptidase [Phycisphaerales bacterium]